jgi:hypothetical protein
MVYLDSGMIQKISKPNASTHNLLAETGHHVCIAMFLGKVTSVIGTTIFQEA